MPNKDDDIIDEETEMVEDEEITEEKGLGEKLKKIREELKKCHTEKAEYLAGWQRSKADFINARQSEEKSRTEFAKYAGEKILKEFLAVADSMELAGKADGDPIYGQLMSILKKEGVLQIESLHKKFDPSYHEALGQTETKNKEDDDMVLEELQKGYKLHERVLRPAKVKVGVYKN